MTIVEVITARTSGASGVGDDPMDAPVVLIMANGPEKPASCQQLNLD